MRSYQLGFTISIPAFLARLATAHDTSQLGRGDLVQLLSRLQTWWWQFVV